MKLMNSSRYPYFARFKQILICLIIFVFTTKDAYACPSPTATFPVYEDFESNAFTHWTHDSSHDFNWRTNSGSTTSGSTGPSSAYSGSYYAYTEATTPNNPNKVANLISPCFDVQSGKSTQISFAYHMYGNGQGSFNLDISTDDGSSWTTLWGLSGNQGNTWLQQTVNLDAYIGQAVKLRFNVVTNTYQSDVAIDEVVISTTSTVEICDDGMDNDGDGLIDEYDPDCGVVCYNDCSTPYLFSWESDSGIGNTWEITNGASSVIRVYTISGALGAYNVSVTLSNPDGQNIDLSNCGTAGNHFYTATCNDPNATVDCDGDPGVADGQFSYGCDFLTFGITSDNSNQTTSITYDFEYPSQICNLQIGDIDYQGSGSAALESWQDEIDVVASNNGIPVAINAIVGSSVNVFNNNTHNLNLVSAYGPGTGGNLLPDDPAGHATITTLDKVTSITFTYSNGPDDEGSSDDHAIRINGFEFCPQEKIEICDNNIDDDGDGLIDCEDVDCGMLDNIEFNDGTNNWSHMNLLGNASTFTIDNSSQLSGVNSAKIEITNAGALSFNTILEQNNASITSGKTYRIFFNAKSSINRDIQVLVQKNGFPYSTYFSQEVPLANFNGQYIYQFTATNTDNNVDLTFYLGQAESTVWLDKIQFKEVCPDPECLLPTDDNYEICDEVNISESVTNNDVIQDNSFNTTYQVTASPTKGNVVMQEDGSFVYTPNSGASGSDVFTYERCYSFKDDVGLSNLIFNPCGDGKIIETFVEGIKGEASPSLLISSPTDFSTIMVEVWAESGCSSVTIEGVVATEYELYTTQNNLCVEKLYRVELSSVSSDGLINISSTGGCSLTSAVAYVERIQSNGQGSSTLIASDIDLYYGYVGGDDCFVYNMPIGTSGTSRDITFTIPLHEKDNVRLAEATIIAGSVSGTGSTTSYTPIGQGAGIIEITLSNVPGDVNVATIEICSPSSSGDSFGVGIISATSLICTEEPSFDCCSDATATINLSGASVTNSNPNICLGGGFSTLVASDNSSSVNNTYAWSHSSETTAQVVVSPATTTTYTVTVTTDQGCTTTAETTVNIIPDLDVDITYSGTLCLEDNTELTAVVTGGAPNYVYSWTGPNSFTAATKVISISENGNYYVTVTDSQGCEGQFSAYVYEEYSPFIFALNTEVCEGENVTLSINSGTAVQFNWGANAGNATTSSVTVTPAPPSTDYIVTVTNDQGCTAEATATIDVIARPVVNVTGPNPICEGETTNLSPTTGGSWLSTNSAVATVTNSGVVTGVSPGSVNFIFTSSTTQCESSPTTPITVNEKTPVSVTGPTAICEGFTSQLSPTTGGVWTSNNPSIATVDNNGVVTGVSEGSTTFIFTNSTTGCASNATQPITINDVPTVVVTGPSTICVGTTTTLSPMSGGTWVSSNSSVATVTNGGVVTALSTGTATFTFTTIHGCVPAPSEEITVDPASNVSISGSSILCEGETTTLTASSGGGTWSSSNNSIANINSSGVVTAVSAGSVTITYNHSSSSCSSSPTFGMTIIDKPTVSISGPTTICVEETSQLSTSGSGGFWTSDDSDVAIVSSSGAVVGTGAGTVTFTYTSSNGCESDATGVLTVDPSVEVEIDFNGSFCLKDDSQLSAIVTGGTAGYNFSWTGPGGFASSAQTIDINLNGNYNITVSDAKGCSSNATAFVYEAYEPFIFALNTEICEGEDVTLSVNSSSAATYQWGPNAGNATTQSITVTPGVPSTTYSVTVTNNIGCTTEATAVIDVDPKPDVNVSGPTSICQNGTTQLSPSTGGIWSSSDYSVATVNNSGLVTGVAGGTATFTYRANGSGCFSDPSEPITVTDNATITISGENQICIGENPTLTASVSGGTWSSSNVGIAQISSGGVVTPNSQGSAIITYTPSAGNCYFNAAYEINIHESPNLSINGPSTICENEITYINASTSGTWTSSDPSIASVSPSGVVTGMSAGTATFSFVSSAGCSRTLATPITVIGSPEISLNGPGDICVNSSTSLLPSSGGVWISSNPNVASVSSSGIVTGVNPGIAMFTFIEYTYGCTSENMISISVNDDPNINGLDDNNLCIGETTTITSSTGGTWTSSNTSVALISNSGNITAVGAGSATFKYTNSLTGCISNASMPLTVNSNPETNFTGPTNICVGENTSITPSSGGAWASTNVAVATISPSGVITGMSPGSVQFIFTNSTTGCTSDASENLTVDNPTEVEITGPSNICVGATSTLSPASGGTWTSSNHNIATVTSGGVVTGIAPGTVTFIFNSNTGCTSDPSAEITIDPKPITNFVGPSSICIGTTTNLSPSSGGTWTSNNPAIATVNNSGLVTGISPGSTNFTFVESITGCAATTATNLNVYDRPVVTISGQDEICIGNTTNMIPSSGGIWVSSNNTVANISPSGVVTGLNAGTVTFTFYESGTGCVSEASDPITILPKPAVAITGNNLICVGETTTLSPTSGGAWQSNNENVATVTDEGVVTALAQGLVKFKFTSDEGCPSNDTAPIIIYGKPSIVLDSPDILCTSDTGQMLPSSGGVWTSNNPSVATIGNDGVFTAISAGAVRFTFVDNSTGCTSDQSDEVTVNATPDISINGPSNVCIGGTTNLVPTTGGIWTSLNPSIATIQNNGEVIGVSAGSVRFLFSNVNSGCVSDTSAFVNISPGPDVTFTGPQELCIGENSSITPSTGGTWMSTNNSIATIDNNGIITAVNQGSVKFIFTESATGCSSGLSETLTVNGAPTVLVSGPSEICIGSTTSLSPSSGGVWTSLQPSIATVDQFGKVTGISTGTAHFKFVDSATGCESNGDLNVTIIDGIDVGISGDAQICVGYTTTLSPSSGGFWSSSNPAVASVTNSGIVTAKAPGVVTFEFIDGTTGCAGNGPTDPVTVELCTNHDFNVTLVGLTIQGNINTNDKVPLATSYSNAVVQMLKPLASLPSLTISPDGTYTFVTNKKGKYMYKVPVCIPPIVSGCPTTYLEINVVEDIYSQANPVGNLEFATTFTHPNPLQNGIPVTINATSNDACVNTDGCLLDASSVNVISGPKNGSTTENAQGEIIYTPDPGFIGSDTIYYSICEDGNPSNCSNSLQVVTVNDNSALNSTVAADDFNYTLKDSPVSGNVMDNDSDPENHVISVIAQGSALSPIVTAQGEYYIESNGDYVFTPANDFVGSTEIIYTLCDNASEQACTDATLHLLVFDDISIRLRVYLEGALMTNGGAFSSFSGLPLMRDDLRVSPFTGQNYIPTSDPYTFAHDDFMDTPSKFLKMGPGLIAKNTLIVDSLGVFSVTGDNAIVDWVHVELRSKDDYTIPIGTRSGLLQRDGDIVDVDGVSNLRFDGINADSFYVVVKHRSHLGVMSMKVRNNELVDFTDPDYPVFNFGTSHTVTNDYTGLSQKEGVVSGYTALWAGDFDSNGQVKFTNPEDDVNILFLSVLFSSPEFLINYNNAYGYFTGDYNMNSKAKYTNPEDDINFLFSQVLLYPLNTEFFSNFNALIEQVPE